MAGTTRAQQRADRAARLAAQRDQQRKADRRRRVVLALSSVVVVLVVIGGLVLIAVNRGSGASSKATTIASPAVVTAVTTVPTSVLAKVGAGTSKANGLTALDGKKLLTGTKPRIVYIGAEYCPFCAAERWPVTIALSRFGTWSGLGQTYSSASDTDPSTPSLAFHGATYTSRYLSFEGVEETTNQRQGSDYAPLDTPTAEQQQLLTTYDAPPYQQGTGSIPFVDIGGMYAITGAAYDPGLLAGKTPEQVASLLAAGTSSQAKAILGAANRLTSAFCSLTGQQPATVCTAPSIRALAGDLPKVG